MKFLNFIFLCVLTIRRYVRGFHAVDFIVHIADLKKQKQKKTKQYMDLDLKMCSMNYMYKLLHVASHADNVETELFQVQFVPELESGLKL